MSDTNPYTDANLVALNRSTGRIINLELGGYMSNYAKSVLIGLTGTSCFILPNGSCAQVAIDLVKPQQALDQNNVDLGARVVRIHRRLVTGGDPARPMTVDMNITSPNLDGREITLSSDIIWDTSYDGSQYIQSVQTPIGSGTFLTAGWANPANNYAQSSVGDGVFELYRNSGDLRIFNADGDYYKADAVGVPTIGRVIYADGEVWTYSGGPGVGFITSSRGYGIQIASDGSSNSSKITFYNKAYVYCDEAALLVCSNVSALPSATITNSLAYPLYSTNVTLPASSGFQLTTSFDNNNNSANLTSISETGVPGSTTSYSYVNSPSTGDRGDGGGSGQLDAVASANNGVSNFVYDGAAPNIDGYAHLGYVDEGVAYDPNSSTSFRIIDSLHFTGGLVSVRDQAGKYWIYGRNGQFKLLSAQFPEGNGIEYTYDARGNVTSETQVPKPNSSLPTLIKTASFPSSCTVVTMVWCNKPTWVKDARGNQTDYTYDPTTGKIATETSPADASGARAQKRYTYIQRYAWVLNSAGGYVHAATPVWLLASEKTCRTTATVSGTCAGGPSDEITTVYEYGPDTGLVGNNLFLRGVAVTADAGGTMTTLRTCFAYDAQGRKVSETKPAGTTSLTECP